VSVAALASEGNVVGRERGASRARNASSTATTGIARLAERTGVTCKALRHYEARGILKPVRSRSGARFFTPHQCDVATAVVLLRKLGTGLDEVGAIMVAGNDIATLAALDRLLDHKIDDTERRLMEVRAARSTFDVWRRTIHEKADGSSTAR